MSVVVLDETKFEAFLNDELIKNDKFIDRYVEKLNYDLIVFDNQAIDVMKLEFIKETFPELFI